MSFAHNFSLGNFACSSVHATQHVSLSLRDLESVLYARRGVCAYGRMPTGGARQDISKIKHLNFHVNKLNMTNIL